MKSASMAVGYWQPSDKFLGHCLPSLDNPIIMPFAQDGQ
jgi:hypothetical protein